MTMIRDVAHAHNDTTQGTMAVVSSDVALYTTFMSSTDDTNGFDRTFLAMVETINVHGRRARFHPQLYANHLDLLRVERNVAPTSELALNKVATERQKKMQRNNPVRSILHVFLF